MKIPLTNENLFYNYCVRLSVYCEGCANYGRTRPFYIFKVSPLGTNSSLYMQQHLYVDNMSAITTLTEYHIVDMYYYNTNRIIGIEALTVRYMTDHLMNY